MSRSILRCLCLLFVASAAAFLAASVDPVEAGKKDKKDPKKFKEGEEHLKNRARWEWTVSGAKDKKAETGKFSAYVDGEVKHGTPQVLVGTWKSLEAGVVRAEFTKGPLQGGTVVLRRVEAKVPTYEGDLERGGTKAKMRVEIIND